MKKIIIPIIHEFPFFAIIYALILGGSLASRNDLTTNSLIHSIGTVFIYAYLATVIVYFTKLKFIKQTFYLMTFILFLVDLYLHIQFETRISPNVFLLLSETNPRESSEFVQTYLLSSQTLLFIAGLFICIGVTYIFEKNKHLFSHYRESRIISFFAFLFLVSGTYFITIHYYRLFQCQDTTEVDVWMKKYEMRAMDNLSNLTYSLYDMSLMRKEHEKALHFALNDIDGTAIEQDSLNVIFVIGESHNKWHSNLYGYPLNTNPLLTKESESGRLYLFHDATAPYNLTSNVLRNLFNTNCLGANEKWLNSAFFPAIFHHSGYEIDFWDNQYNPASRNSFDFSLNSYIHNPIIESSVYSKTNNHCFKLDEELIKDYFNIKPSNSSPRKLIMFHLMGQHFAYYTRFPHNKGFDHFTSDSIIRKDNRLTKDMRQIIADYDNATRYVDYILYRIIDHYKNTNSVVVYLSDHGEDVFDSQTENRRSLERNVSVPIMRQQFNIPFFIWCSDIYKNQHKDMMGNIEAALQKPFSSDNICHLLFHLAGIQTKYYIPERDIINPVYKCPKRLINDIIDYDQAIRKAISLTNNFDDNY